MYSAIFRALAIAAGTAIVLSGCQFLGPRALNQGRDQYNSTIQSTSMAQTMSNIVRVYNHQPTLFMDVTEVDAAQSFQGQLTGGATSIGAQAGNRSSTAGTITGRLGSAQGMVQYSETPTIRYVPLLGQALVQQLVTPVSVEAQALLFDSYWRLAPLIDMSTGYLTLDKDESYSALNTMMELDWENALEFVAEKSDWTKVQDSTSQGDINTTSGKVTLQVTNKSADSGAKDTLTMYLLPYHPHALGMEETSGNQPEDLQEQRRRLQLWVRLLRIYLGTQPQPEITCQIQGLPDSSKTLQTNQQKHPVNRREIIKNLLYDAEVEKYKIGKNLRDASFEVYERKVKEFLSALEHNVDVYIATSDDFAATIACLRDTIELRTDSVPYQKAKTKSPSNQDDDQTAADRLAELARKKIISHAPMMRNFSAVGILKAATERPHPLIEFVTSETYGAIAAHDWNKDSDNLSYYTLLLEDEDSVNCKPEQKQNGGCDNPSNTNPDKIEVSKWIAEHHRNHMDNLFVYEKKDGDYDYDLCITKNRDHEENCGDVLNDAYVKKNEWLGLLRRYILIIVDNNQPVGPTYAEYHSDRDGRWYYIDANDEISQKNFHLLSLFMTMMATPSQTPPLTPTINVGGS
jgi:hypothetical protein